LAYFLTLSGWIDSVNRRIAGVVVWCTLAMILLSFLNALLRRIGRTIGENLTWGTAMDLQWVLFGFVFLATGGYTILTNSNVRVDIFYRNFSSRRKSFVEIIAAVFFLIPFSALVIYMSWPMVSNAIAIWEKSTLPGGISPWMIKPLIPFGFFLILIQGVSGVIKNIAYLLDMAPNPHVSFDH